MPCFLATWATGALSASRRILTIWSSVNRAFRIDSSLVAGAIFSTFKWSENCQAGQVDADVSTKNALVQDREEINSILKQSDWNRPICRKVIQEGQELP